MPERVRISVDAMGGDYAPQNIVSGCVEAVSDLDVCILLCGMEAKVSDELKKHRGAPSDRIRIVDAPEVVGMDEPATTALRRKRHSSLRVAVDLAANGEVDAFVSAGNTGAVYATVKLGIGSLPGVDRLPLAALFPHPSGKSIVLDVGANVDCKPTHLLEFALMGSLYAEEILNIDRPKVGLLSIGEEETKGNELTKEVFGLLKASDLNFIGNIDGHDVFRGKADVVVCDGFTGNVALKVSESLVTTILQLLEQEIEEQPKIATTVNKYFDYSEYGCAPLLGAKVPSFVCHGRSTAKAMKNAIHIAFDFVRHNINERIHKRLSQIVA